MCIKMFKFLIILRIERNEWSCNEKNQELDVARKTVQSSQHNMKLAKEKVTQLRSKHDDLKHQKKLVEKLLDSSERKMSSFIK